MDRRRVLELFDMQKDLYEKKVAEGIEKHRKGDAALRIVDKDGNPIKNASVKISQKSHEFRFGANLFMLDELESDEKNEKYKKYFKDVFNMATLPFYWSDVEPERGKPRYEKDSPKIYRRPPIDLCIEFCEKYGIEPREHALAYEHFFPAWLRNADVDEIKRELERRCSEISERYADKIPTIEVTNEMDWGEGQTKFYDEPDFVEWCFKLCDRYFPKNQLVINECTGIAWNDTCRSIAKYYAYTEAAMLKGARIDAIGLQYHLFHTRENEYESTRKTLDPKNLYDHMDLYANRGKPLQITEVTVPAYSWNKDDEEIQAEIIEKLYSVWFSHPSVEQIIYWNLVDGYAFVWDPSKIAESQGDMTLGENYYHGGLLRFDLSPKPAYEKIKELTQKVWHTEAEAKTSPDGTVNFRGFYGKYSVTVNVDGKEISKEITLSKNSSSEITLNI